MAQSTPVRCLIELHRISRCFQTNHKQTAMEVFHVEVGLAFLVTLLPRQLLVPNSPGTSPPVYLNLHDFQNPI